jgi:hypothetical protein
MTRITSLFLGTVGVSIFLFPADGRSDQSAELQKQLREEAPSAWKRFQQFMLHSKGTVEFEKHTLIADDPGKSKQAGARGEASPKSRETIVHTMFEVAGPDCRRAIAHHRGAPQTLVGCRNPRYQFSLIGSASDKDAYRIKRVKAGLGGPDYSSSITNLDTTFLVLVAPLLYAPWTVIFFDMAEILNDKDFVCKSVQSRSHGDEKLVEVVFDFRHPTENYLFRDVKMILDPQNGWAVREFTVISPPSGTEISGKITYSGTRHEESGFRPPTKLEQKWTSYNANKTKVTETEEHVSTFSSLEFVDVPESEFMLSAFGLSEPSPTSLAPGLKWGLVLINIGVVVCIIAFFLFFRHPKRRQASTSEDATSIDTPPDQ